MVFCVLKVLATYLPQMVLELVEAYGSAQEACCSVVRNTKRALTDLINATWWTCLR